MAGHSKWKNIMHKKEKTDTQRAKIFTKIGKEMTIAIREGGSDPSSNSRLRDLITKAKQNNVPNDNIDRIINKASNADGITYDEIVYEGYGPSGVAVIVATATDNRNRTASDLRHYFDKFGGNLGQTGCVSYMFTDKGVVIIEKDQSIDEEQLMEDAIDAGAEDITPEDDIYEIITEPNDVYAVASALEKKEYKIMSNEKDKLSDSYITLEDEDDIKKMNLLLEHLEDNDDVQEVYHNWENREE